MPVHLSQARDYHLAVQKPRGPKAQKAEEDKMNRPDLPGPSFVGGRGREPFGLSSARPL